jgi:hypothetical protein
MLLTIRKEEGGQVLSFKVYEKKNFMARPSGSSFLTPISLKPMLPWQGV